jgi:uncharacterized protein (DUF1800 family)
LHRRAGFAATWSEIQRDLTDDPGACIDRLLAGKARSQGLAENFEQIAGLLADSAREGGRLKAWWFYRMFFGPDPLGERLTLMWHNHFATSALKVRDLGQMQRQNALFRELARAPFDKLLNAVVRDPAMLVWLDASFNRKGHPNENLGRELMELFTLGIGHYTETDVKEAARALTGWPLSNGKYRDQHDDGEKTILGHKGRWQGSDLLRFVLDHPATPQRLAMRICELFMGEGAVDAAGVKALATGLREHNLEIGWAVETVLRSQAFFAETNLGTRGVGPVEYVVGSARVLELFESPPSTLLLADWAARMGQDLFYPPNVGGWPGGRSWITTQTMIGRTNYAAALVGGSLSRRQEPFDALALAGRHGRGSDPDAVVAFYGELLTGQPPSSAWHNRLLASLEPKGASPAETARKAVALILASPENQLA